MPRLVPRPLLRLVPHGRRTRITAAALAVIVLGALIVVFTTSDDDAPAVMAHEEFSEVPAAPGSPSRERLDTTLYVPETARETPAPAILLPHGFGGSKHSVAGDAKELAERGFVVLAYTARGFGRSTGMITLNDPDAEVADASHLLDYLAAQPTVQRDTDNDPRVAVTGSSYAGALALSLAGTDERVDAIAPVMTYHDLAQSLLPNTARAGRFEPRSPARMLAADDGVFKEGWAGVLFSGGLGGGGLGAATDAPEPGAEENDVDTADPAVPPASDVQGDPGDQGSGQGGARGAQPCGRFAPQICAAYSDLVRDGEASDRTLELLERASPKSVTEHIDIPTLLVQGERDTLFGLDQADANARGIHDAGGEVQVVWYAGGHDGGGPGPALRGSIADWLAFQLDGPQPPKDNPLPAFRYDVQGTFQATRAPSVRVLAADRYPGLGRDVDRVEHESVELTGQKQVVINPPGGTPAAVSGIPGFGDVAGSSLRTGMFGIDLPGQSARFISGEFEEQLLVTGSSTVRLRITPQPWSGGARDAEATGPLFVKLYDVGPTGQRTLPGNAVSPVRLPELEVGEATEVTVSLPPIVRPVAPGHRLELVVSTTDQAYANAPEPAAYRIELAQSGELAVPEVSGTSMTSGWPVWQLAGIGGLALLVVALAVVTALRRRRADSVVESLADVPLDIRGLTKSYPGGITAVSDLSFRAERGQVLGLLGPNGAGKTTTLRMLMGLVTPTSGEMRVFGHRVRPGAPVLSRIGSFVEGPGFLPHLSGAANLRLYWDATGRPADQAHVAEALEIAGLGDAVHRKVGTYSQGMRQRLAIAQAMLGLPELLVLDEPTNGLDPPQIHQMREVLRRYAATGRTVLVSSHLLAEVEQTSTHVVVMHRGELVADGAVGEIVAAGGEASFVVDKPDDAVAALNDVDGISAERADGDTVHADLDGLPRSAAVSALVAAGVAVENAGPRRRLEDAFLRLVTSEGQER
ncbi:alpha/beta fold hydrolase [Haloechinothrix halophila]|uniref:alpha/beta fold hydrolase n=1 Tax=Haloechinothrix halophila TaxID=1069073 RepID=UPI00040E3E41|nr:alpha/beta fold hydrolase [Haloechinothrix halophila]